MIDKAAFSGIDKEVFEAVQECFKTATANEARNGEMICFLAQGDYNSSLPQQYNPHCIDEKADYYKEADRQHLLHNFLNHRYSFDQKEVTDDDSDMTIIELMTYSHIWESVPYLKMLRRLACMCNSMDYEWKVNVPPMGKHNFIRNDVRDLFGKKNLKIYDIIKKGFQSQLRDAFAHSDFSFQWHQGYIWLYNYNSSQPHHVQEISFDEWTIKFCYAFLLNYRLNELFYEGRQNIHKVYGTNEFIIPLPDGNGGFQNVEIVYSPLPHDMFQFKPKPTVKP